MKPSRPGTSTPASGAFEEKPGFLVRSGLALADWSERWFPDPLVFAFLGVVIVFTLGVLAGERPGTLAVQGGKAFWSLVPFTMQMVMIIIGGYVVARLMRRVDQDLIRSAVVVAGGVVTVWMFARL